MKKLLILITLLTITISAIAEFPKEQTEKFIAEWYAKGYEEGYTGGTLDEKGRIYDESGKPDYEFDPQEAWDEIAWSYEDDFSQLPIEIRKTCSEVFIKGWLEGYSDGWHGHPKKKQPVLE